MNDVLHLKGQFEQKANGSKPGAPTLAAGKYVTANHLIKLRDDLIEMCKFWENQSLLPKALVTAYYNKIAAKSNRINAIFSYNGLPANDTIVGAKYNDTIDKHIITHYVSLDTIYESTRRINEAIKIVEKEYNGKVIAKQLNDPTFIQNLNFSKC